MTNEELIRLAHEEGFSAAEVIDTALIQFNPAFRPYCEENLCGQYNANYSCPPTCGTPEQMEQKVRSHKKALVLQTIHEVSDYSDKPLIKKTKGIHNAAELSLLKKVRNAGCDGFLIGASGCALCTPCAIQEGKPCRFPDLSYSCLSAYCINAKALADSCSMEYDCGPGLLAFFGAFIFD